MISRKPQWHFFKLYKLWPQSWSWQTMFELKLDKLSFFVGRSWSRCASGGCQEEQGEQKRRLIFVFVFFWSIFIFFFVDLCICICSFPYKTVLSSGGGLGSEQEGEERRGGHLPCLPWGPGRGRAGSEIVQVGKDQSASLPGWHSGLSLPAASPSGLSHQVAQRPWYLSLLQGKCQH